MDKSNEAYKKHYGINLQCYDPINQSCEFRQSLPKKIKNTRGASAITVASQIYLVGGEGCICACYSPSQNQWTTLKRPELVQVYASVVHIDGIIYLCGGGDYDDDPQDDIEAYNIEQNTWESLDIWLPEPLMFHFCAVLPKEQ